MPEERYDVVIVGASFAGLAAAGALAGAGRVLVVDRKPPGVGETSACGTLLAVLERLDALEALEQVHPDVVVNVAGRRVVVHPPYPFATFHYRTLCTILAGRLGDGELRVAPFEGLDSDGALLVGGRRVTAPILVDASGWRAMLARALGAPEPRHVSFGLETRHGHGGCDLEFWIRSGDHPEDVLWAFPAGDHVGEGVASYLGSSKGLRAELARFLHEHEFGPRAVHGGFFPAELRDPVVGRAFVLGDAAGLCLPLTGEGIRPALVWGQVAGRQARRVLSGEVSLEAALAAYRGAVLAHRREYALLHALQRGLLRVPLPLLPPVVRIFAEGPLARLAQQAYRSVADPQLLEAFPGIPGSTRGLTERCVVHTPGGQPGDTVRCPDPTHCTCETTTGSPAR